MLKISPTQRHEIQLLIVLLKEVVKKHKIQLLVILSKKIIGKKNANPVFAK